MELNADFLTLQNSPETDYVYSPSHNYVYSWWFVFEQTCLKDACGEGAENEGSYRTSHPILKCKKSALPHSSTCCDFCTNFMQKHAFTQKVFLPSLFHRSTIQN